MRRRPLVLLKLLLMRVMLIREWCRDCGRTIEPIWRAPDKLWNDALGLYDAGPRCIPCFTRRALRQGWLLIWKPERLDGYPFPWDV